MAYFYWTEFRSQLRDRGFLTTASRKSVRDSSIKKGCASLSIHRVPISATMGASPHNLPSFHDFFFSWFYTIRRVCILFFSAMFWRRFLLQRLSCLEETEFLIVDFSRSFVCDFGSEFLGYISRICCSASRYEHYLRSAIFRIIWLCGCVNFLFILLVISSA